jgi:hypothetical protein
VSLVRLDHDPLKRLEVGVLVKEVHTADRSVQHMVHLPDRCSSRFSWHGQETHQKAVAPVITSCVPVSVRRWFRLVVVSVPSLFPSPDPALRSPNGDIASVIGRRADPETNHSGRSVAFGTIFKAMSGMPSVSDTAGSGCVVIERFHIPDMTTSFAPLSCSGSG